MQNERNGQPQGEVVTDLLWSWKFERQDWIGMSIAIGLFCAYAFLLLWPSSDWIARYGMMLCVPWVNVLVICVLLILKPPSNSTRIPAVILILICALAIALNISLL